MTKTHVEWTEHDYQRARDCMFQILGGSYGWPLQEKDCAAFDNAFQHAVGILSLTACTHAAGAREEMSAALEAWDAYGGFDTWEDTARKAGDLAGAIRVFLES